ncbi:MAG TPA: CoA ester lyase [Candidatus Saccharimonadales bacterium]|nr:CoA ester lyase [Candidatus Saccharimonadales bacterium]
MDNARRIRSLLFAPGSDPKKLSGVFRYGADAVDLDLEDSVSTNEKVAARGLVAAVLARPPDPGGPLVVVRLNGPTTGLAEADLEAVLQPSVFALHITKIDDVESIQRLDRLASKLEAERRMPVGGVRLICSIDSAHLVLRLPELARSTPRLYCFIIGGYDYANDIGVAVSKEMTESLWARSYGVLVSRDAGLAPPLHPPSAKLEDPGHWTAIAASAKALGFQGVIAIHPKQLSAIAAVFAPTDDEVAWARQVVDDFAEAERRGTAAIRVRGELVDYAMVKRAEQILRSGGDLTG